MKPPDSINGISVGSTVFIPGDPALYVVERIFSGCTHGWMLELAEVGQPHAIPYAVPAWKTRLVPRPVTP
jgi:hypothetical protein